MQRVFAPHLLRQHLANSKQIFRPATSRPRMSTSQSLAADAPKAAETDEQAETVANTTGVTVGSLQKTLEQKLGAQHVDIEDMSGK